MLECPFCRSQNTQYLSLSDGIYKKYAKESEKGMAHSTEKGTYYYPIAKAICLDCGYVFEKMSDENLKRYHEEKQLFTNQGLIPGKLIRC